MSQNKELLRRWINGDITRAEEAQLFRLAQQDPFLKDALDGYQRFSKSDHAAKLKSIQRQLSGQEKRRPVAIPLKWIAAAASILLAVGAAWLIIPESNKEKGSESIAQQESLNREPEASMQEGQNQQPEEQAKAIRPEMADNSAGPGETKPSSEEQIADLPKEISPEQDIAAAEKEVPVQEPKFTEPTNIEVTPVAEEPAMPDYPPKTPKTMADQARRVPAGAATSFPKKFNDTQESVAPYNLRESKPASRELRSRYSAMQSVQPVGGFEALEKYLDSLYLLEGKKLPQKPASVVLEFTVSADSSISNFKIINSVNKKWDEWAKEALKNGPRWYLMTGQAQDSVRTRYAVKINKRKN